MYMYRYVCTYICVHVYMYFEFVVCLFKEIHTSQTSLFKQQRCLHKLYSMGWLRSVGFLKL